MVAFHQRGGTWPVPTIQKHPKPLKPVKKTIKLTLMMLALALVSSGDAALIVINNHSFETPALASDGNLVETPVGTNGTTGTGVLHGWNYVVQYNSSFESFGIENQGSGAYTGAAGSGTPSGADGVNNVYLNNDNSGLFTGIFQNVGALLANTQYTLTIAIGQRLDRTNGSLEFGLYNATTGATNIWATGTALNTDTKVSTTAGSFQDFVVTFTTGATVSNDLYVAARHTETANFIQASLDNVRLDATAVPEPGSFALLLGGIGMLPLFRRRRA